MEISFKNTCIKKALLAWKYVTFLFCRCDLCLQPSRFHSLLCQVCYEDLRQFELDSCQQNLLNYPKVIEKLPKLNVDHLVCVAPYQWPYSTWISQLKYQHRFELSGLLAMFLSKQLVTMPASFQSATLIPVPLHARRLKARQYNQASLIARCLVKIIDMPINEHIIFRAKQTTQQVGQTGASRRRNLKGAFAIKEDAEMPERVVILDDVITTGATVNEMATLLKIHGVKEVTVLCVCIALT